MDGLASGVDMNGYGKTLSRLAALLGLTMLAGCFTSPSRGEAGVVRLAYDEGLLGCLFGCDAAEPMAARANTFLDVVNSDEIPAFDVSSSDATVLEFFQNDGTGDDTVRVVSHASGSAHIVFTDISGEELDRFELEVADIDRIELRSPEIRDRYLLMIGSSDGLGLDLFDASGRRLKGYGGVDYALSGSIGESQLGVESALVSAIAASFIGSTSEGASVDALELGEGEIQISAPSGAELTIPVEIVDESAVARVEVPDVSGEAGFSESVDALTFADDGERIHEPTCEWSIEPADGPVTLEAPSNDSATVRSSVAGTATVTCTVGSQSASGTVTFAPEEP